MITRRRAADCMGCLAGAIQYNGFQWRAVFAERHRTGGRRACSHLRHRGGQDDGVGGGTAAHGAQVHIRHSLTDGHFRRCHRCLGIA